MRRRDFLASSLTAASTVGFGSAFAQGSGTPLKIIVPFPPGGHPDLVARLLSVPLGQLLDQPVVVENRAGAGGLIGAQAVLQSKPDGNTMIMNTASTAVFVTLTRDPMPYDPLTAFMPVAMLGAQPLALAVNSGSPAKTLTEIIGQARKANGAFSYGSSGVGSLTHVIFEYFKQKAGGLDVQHVPYKGSLAAVTDLAGGRVEMVIDTLSTMQPFVRDGRIRQLALFSDKPHEAAPGIPTARSQGVDLVAQAFNILAFPAGTPPARFEKVSTAVQSAIRRPEFQSALSKAFMSFDPDFGPKECADFLANEVAVYTKVIRSAGISAN